ncbi:hypothetical protein [Marininema halotolerans]|uniref:hypothetical protein n=1 Tax=Marininema halotolerans TaxID=1155944 RepID=UPI000B84FBBB|nr:hypothetical protein [Marininema halotolerans]
MHHEALNGSAKHAEMLLNMANVLKNNVKVEQSTNHSIELRTDNIMQEFEEYLKKDETDDGNTASAGSDDE